MKLSNLEKEKVFLSYDKESDKFSAAYVNKEGFYRIVTIHNDNNFLLSVGLVDEGSTMTQVFFGEDEFDLFLELLLSTVKYKFDKNSVLGLLSLKKTDVSEETSN